MQNIIPRCDHNAAYNQLKLSCWSRDEQKYKTMKYNKAYFVKGLFDSPTRSTDPLDP
jgi:hypothetical protein